MKLNEEEQKALERLGEVIGLGAGTAEVLIDLLDKILRKLK